jgi:hypothetical protein
MNDTYKKKVNGRGSIQEIFRKRPLLLPFREVTRMLKVRVRLVGI